MKSVLTKSQTKTLTKQVKPATRYDYDKITVTVRYDDQCGNGHNTFSITGETTVRGREDTGGCIHEEIAKHFPELQHLIKWHLVSSDGPMHYIANTLHHASDKDCHGLRKGEKKQIINGRTKKPSWKLTPVDSEGEEINADLPAYVDGNKCPEGSVTYKYVPWCRIGEGKEPDLKAARSSAVWPDATLEQLRDEEALKDRLPTLLKAFRADIEAVGFTY